jgi:predicted nucleic acid-binding protein
MRLVIDTNIFIKAFDMSQYTIQCDSFVMGLFNKENHGIILDFEDEIRSEYWDNLSTNERFIKIYTELEHQRRISFVSGKLNNKHKKRLIELGFHEPEDLAFVGATMNADKIIITEDSDYGKGPSREAQVQEKQIVLAYLSKEMVMQVFDSLEAKTLV